MTSNLSFQQLVPAKDPDSVSQLLALLGQALSTEGLSNYFTRRNAEVAARLWVELLRLSVLASPTSQQPQLYFLSDYTTAAIMQQWPEDRVGWHRHAALLRLAKIAPLGKWRALREAMVALERQKAAFLESHGPFLYLAAIGTAAEVRGRGLGSMLLDHCCRVADRQQRFLYTEATSEQARTWLKRAGGFFELLQSRVRPHAPVVYVMVRKPRAPDSAGSGGSTKGQQQQGAAVVQVRAPPAGSVRTRR